MIWMDVDAALAEVPVNLIALTDDTDFKTREVAIVYNQAGMDLVWNFVTTAGAVTQTAVTPTTAGVHDWVHQGDGMYTLEIPASAGTINNDTEGFGYFTGICTGVLHWRGPDIGFRAAGLNNLIIDDAFSATRGLAGTGLPDAAADAAGGLPISDLGGFAVDGTALEATLGTPTDTDLATDLVNLQSDTDDLQLSIAILLEALILQTTTIATLASQVSFTLTAGSADNAAYEGATIVVVDASTGTQKAFGSLSAYTGVSKTVTLAQDPGVFTMAVGDKVHILPSDVFAIWDRLLTGATHNENGSAGRRLRALSGQILEDGIAQSATANTIVLESGDVTTDNEFVRSKVIIVGGTGTGQEAIITESVASTDTLTVTPAWLVTPDATSEYEILPAQVHSTVRNGGYDGARVYVDTVNGVAGTQKGVNGTSTNPVDNLTDAYTIAANEMISAFEIEPGSLATLPADSTARRFFGRNYTILLNGADINESFFEGAILSGIATGGANAPVFFLCGFAAVTMPPANGNECSFFGRFTMGSAGAFTFGASSELVAGAFVIDYGVALNASTFALQGWTGGNVEIENAGAGTGTYKFDMNGTGDLTINANCSATTEVDFHGSIGLTNNASGITISQNENYRLDSILSDSVPFLGASIADILADVADMQPKLGTPVVTISDDLAAVQGTADDIETKIDAQDAVLTLPGQATPGQTPTPREAQAELYKNAVNKSDQNSTTRQFYANDGTTVDTKQTVSDSGSVITTTKKVAGP